MEAGVQAKNTQRYVNVSKIYKTITPMLAKALPGFHSFKGCDFTAAFARKGKSGPFHLFEKEVELQETFAKLCEGIMSKEVERSIEKFVCAKYGQKKCFFSKWGSSSYLRKSLQTKENHYNIGQNKRVRWQQYLTMKSGTASKTDAMQIYLLYLE
jgi:hypothetical protein